MWYAAVPWCAWARVYTLIPAPNYTRCPRADTHRPSNRGERPGILTGGLGRTCDGARLVLEADVGVGDDFDLGADPEADRHPVVEALAGNAITGTKLTRGFCYILETPPQERRS